MVTLTTQFDFCPLADGLTTVLLSLKRLRGVIL